jgi:leucyl aminopeptidase
MPQSAIIADPDRIGGATPLHLVQRSDELPEAARPIAQIGQFRGEAGQLLVTSEGVFVGSGQGDEPFALGTAAAELAGGDYRLASLPEKMDRRQTILGFALGAYRFETYRQAGEAPVLIVEDAGLAASVSREAASIGFGRDLINTPAEEMSPDHLEGEARKLAQAFGAAITVHRGENFEEGFPLIHAVGRAAAIPPRLIELHWKGEGATRSLALVGKGVCFDSGGLNVKGGKGMALMKKDMGGAATALALSRRIMEEALPIDLRLYVPAVENAIGGNAFRPGDVYRSRAGQSVEISNTDAEGRLILADAMTLATESRPDRLLTLATLTGAARVALGPDLPPLYSTEESFQKLVLEKGAALDDPLWPMPFWDRYNEYLRSDIADVNHAASTPFAGSITAALFLKRFAGTVPFTHIDTFGWMPAARPGRPKGGEPLALRALFEALRTESKA